MIKIIIFLLLIIRLSAQAYSLEECVKIAIMNKESLKAKVLDAQSATAGVKSSLSNILPSISFGSSWGETHAPVNTSTSSFDLMDTTFSTTSTFGGVSNTWNTSLSLSQPIYDGGQWWNKIASAKNTLTMTEQFVRQEKINIILNVHQSFYQFLKTEQLLGVAKRNLKLARQQVELASKQYELGAVKKTDLLKAEVQLGRSKADFLIRKTALHNAKLTLRNSMGLMGSNAVYEIVEKTRPLFLVPDLDISLSEMVEYSPSLLVQQSIIAGAELNRKLIGGMRLPSVNASFSYGSSADEFEGMAQLDDWSSNITLSMSVPIFTGYSLSSRQQQAELDLRKEQYNYLSQKKNLRVQLENLLETLDNYKDIIPINEQIVSSAEEDLNLVQKRYRLGSADILEVLDAQVSLSQARSSLVTTKYDARIQEAQLRAILGTLDHDYR